MFPNFFTPPLNKNLFCQGGWYTPLYACLCILHNFIISFCEFYIRAHERFHSCLFSSKYQKCLFWDFNCLSDRFILQYFWLKVNICFLKKILQGLGQFLKVSKSVTHLETFCSLLNWIYFSPVWARRVKSKFSFPILTPPLFSIYLKCGRGRLLHWFTSINLRKNTALS